MIRGRWAVGLQIAGLALGIAMLLYIALFIWVVGPHF